MIPRSHADLVKRREAMKIWADATFGMVGRSPDYLNTVLMTWAEGADFFGQRGEQVREERRGLLQVLPRPRSVPDPRHRQSADRPLEGLASARRCLRASRRGRGDQGRPDRPRRQDAGDTRSHRRRAADLSATRHPRGRGALRARLRHSHLDPGLALHLPRAVRYRHAVGVRSSARRALRGARRGLRVQRRADPVGAGVSLRRRQDGQRAVRAGEHPQPHGPPDRRSAAWRSASW